LTEVIPRSAKAMPQVRQPGNHGKEATVLFFPYSITRTVCHQHFTNFLPVTPATWFFCLGML